MAVKNPDVDYQAELATIRSTYVGLTPKQRLGIMAQRMLYKDSGPNNLVNAVSAVEALARALLCRIEEARLGGIHAAYKKYRSATTLSMIERVLAENGHDDPRSYLGEDTWELLGYAVAFRHMVTHECTYIGQDKSPSLLEACGEAVTELARFAELDASALVAEIVRDDRSSPRDEDGRQPR